MKTETVATGPIIGTLPNCLAFRIVLSAYFDNDGKITKYATHVQSLEDGKLSKFDGHYFEAFNCKDTKELENRAIEDFANRVADYKYHSLASLADIEAFNKAVL